LTYTGVAAAHVVYMTPAQDAPLVRGILYLQKSSSLLSRPFYHLSACVKDAGLL